MKICNIIIICHLTLVTSFVGALFIANNLIFIRNSCSKDKILLQIFDPSTNNQQQNPLCLENYDFEIEECLGKYLQRFISTQNRANVKPF